jgi:hypothetical protein
MKHFRKSLFIIHYSLFIILASCTTVAVAQTGHRMPLATDYANSTWPRWLAKPVSASRLLDSCDSLSTWKPYHEDQGQPAVTVTHDDHIFGNAAIRLRAPTNGPTPIPQGRYYGTASAWRVVNNEDWSKWNRISVWIRPHLPGFYHVSLIIRFHNEGVEKVPDVYTKMGVNYVLLNNDKWNHIVWEIANLPRDKVTGLEFAYRVQGHEPGATNEVQYDIDKIELQKVDADYYEGWAVAPGRIAFSNPGYQVGSPKSALASDLTARTFELVNAASGAVVLRKSVKAIDSPLGRFQVMDFTEVTTPGTYFIRAGARTTKTFRIAEDVWESSLWKAINFFYVERCGYAVPGVHDVCHADWDLQHGDQHIIVNGGWHDAGDLSQNLVNTAECDYAMFTLLESLQQRNLNPALRDRLREEAEWGLQFVMKTSFHDGFRTEFNTMDRWTDGIVGTDDDMVANASKSPEADFTCASVEAVAARVLRHSEPVLAGRCLTQAEEDWKFGVRDFGSRRFGFRRRPRPTTTANAGAPPQGTNPAPPSASAGAAAPPPRRRSNPMSAMFGGSVTELAGFASLAGIELWKSTDDQQYADKAVVYGKMIVNAQERSVKPGMRYPITGFFYTDPQKVDLLRYEHLSREQAPTVALVKLCEAFPNHPDWMQWYSAVTLYAKYYQEAMANFTQPYGMLCNSVYKDDEYNAISGDNPEITPESYREQVLNGVKVGDHYYVRRFPVWFEFRGNHATTLAQSVALSEAAHLRGDYDLTALLQQELEWVIGRNPFVESTMWGEGYDYAPQYTAMSGNIVGSLPVGIQTHRNRDAPYWPTENCHNWKEVFGIPTGRWIWLMKNLSGPAMITGAAVPGARIEFRDAMLGTDTSVNADPSGAFSATVPEGAYEIDSAGEQRTMSLLSGGTYSVDLRPGHGFDLQLSQQTDASGNVTITAQVRGFGTHTLAVRASNVTLDHARYAVALTGGTQTVAWHGKVDTINSPWVAVVIPDQNFAGRKEATGLAWRAQ